MRFGSAWRWSTRMTAAALALGCDAGEGSAPDASAARDAALEAASLEDAAAAVDGVAPVGDGSPGLDGAPGLDGSSREGGAGDAGFDDGGSEEAGLDGARPGSPVEDNVVFIWTHHGASEADFRPTGTETRFTLSPILAPFTALRDHLLVVDGVDGPRVPAGHQFSHAYFSTGGDVLDGPPTSVGSPTFVGAAPSIDHVITAALGVRPPLVASVPVRSTVPSFVHSWERSRDAADVFVSPVELLSASFPTSTDPDVTTLAERVRAVSTGDVGATLVAQREVIALTLAKGANRVVSWRLATPELPARSLVPTARCSTLNECAHDSPSGSLATFTALNVAFAEQIAALASTLDAIPTADGGTLLDHTLLVWLNDVGFERPPSQHHAGDLPLVIVGNASGRLRTGAWIRIDRPYGDFLHTLGAAMGLDLGTFGADEAGRTPIAELLTAP